MSLTAIIAGLTAIALTLMGLVLGHSSGKRSGKKEGIAEGRAQVSQEVSNESNARAAELAGKRIEVDEQVAAAPVSDVDRELQQYLRADDTGVRVSVDPDHHSDRK